MAHKGLKVPGRRLSQFPSVSSPAMNRPRTARTARREFRAGTSVLAFSIVIVALLLIPAGVLADDFVGGLPLTTVQSGTVTGDLWMDINPAPNWGSQDVVKTFTLPAAAVAEPGRIKWARLYVSAYSGHMQNDYAFSMTTSFDGDGVSGYEQVWPETAHEGFNYIYYGGNDNSEFAGHGNGEPYLMLNDHETRVTSDYFAYYDVTNMITSQTVNVNVNTVGSYDGRIKVITLVVAYDDPSSTTQTTYFVNQGHDVCSYYTEDNFGNAAVGTTTFATTGITGITSATLTADYMASNNGYYGFPTADNDFTCTGGTPPVEGNYLNLPLDRIPDVQGAYSGVDSWDVTSSLTGANDVTFAYSRYFPGTGTSAFYKIPLAFLVIKKPIPVSPPVAQFAADDTTPDVGQTVTFTDSSTNTPTSWAWTIEGTQGIDYQYVDSTSATSQNPHVKFLVAGTYDITLVATNAGGSDDEAKTDYITASVAVPAPVIDLTATPISGFRPLTVTFSATNTGGAADTWDWDFGDGTTHGATQNPSHQYTTAGTYTVKLTATNAGGSDVEEKSGYITVNPNINLGFTGANGAATVNPYPAYVFARETNNVQVKTIKNFGTDAATNIVVALYASDVSSTVPVGTVTIASVAAGATAPTQTITDPTIREAGASVTYTAVLDPDNLIVETNEADNTRTSPTKTVLYNGYKGKRYWDYGGDGLPDDIITRQTYDLHGDIVYYTQPDSAYKSVGWTTRTETWTAANLPVPAGATVEKVLLFFSYNWDQTAGGYPNLVTTFNGNSINLGTPYRDWSNFGAYADYEYGLYPAYDVTDIFNVNGDNTLVTNPGNGGADNQVALYPSTLLVIYSDPSATRKQIFINEEYDCLGVSQASYGTTLAEATAYAPFSGMTIDTGNVQSAKLHSFATNAGPAEGNVFFNGNSIGTNAYTGSTFSSFAVVFDVKNCLTATGNEAAIQGTESGGMGAIQQILVVEYAAAPPVAAFSATPLAGTAPLTVLFTDTSSGNPTTRVWDFGDGNSTWTEAGTTFAHTYVSVGTYDVTLTVTNAAGSDSEAKTGYISVTTGVITIPGQANPPTDPDSDGLYEDLNANNRKDMGDVVLYFENKDWIAANEPLSSFDFNGNARIDLGDVVVLFEEMV